MFYQREIRYAGDPAKAIVGDSYVLTTIAKDVPVTHLEVEEFLSVFRFFAAYEYRLFPGEQLQIRFQANPGEKFIGEKVLIYELLEVMLRNSLDAGAKIFRTDVFDDGDRIRFVVSDDGRGLNAETEHLVLRGVITQKSSASGLTLWLTAVNIRKIGAEVAYIGKGLDGVGASFSITFLKNMPVAD